MENFIQIIGFLGLGEISIPGLILFYIGLPMSIAALFKFDPGAAAIRGGLSKAAGRLKGASSRGVAGRSKDRAKAAAFGQAGQDLGARLYADKKFGGRAISALTGNMALTRTAKGQRVIQGNQSRRDKETARAARKMRGKAGHERDRAEVDNHLKSTLQLEGNADVLNAYAEHGLNYSAIADAGVRSGVKTTFGPYGDDMTLRSAAHLKSSVMGKADESIHIGLVSKLRAQNNPKLAEYVEEAAKSEAKSKGNLAIAYTKIEEDGTRTDQLPEKIKSFTVENFKALDAGQFILKRPADPGHPDNASAVAAKAQLKGAIQKHMAALMTVDAAGNVDSAYASDYYSTMFNENSVHIEVKKAIAAAKQEVDNGNLNGLIPRATPGTPVAANPVVNLETAPQKVDQI